MKELKIEFETQAALDNFATWLCGQGEQYYWNYMEYREQETKDKITAIRFHYHGKENTSYPENSSKRYQEFMSDNIIRTDIGRLNR